MKLTLNRWEAAALYVAIDREILYQSGGEWHAPGDTEALEGLLSAVGLGVSLAAGLFDAAAAVWGHVRGEEGER